MKVKALKAFPFAGYSLHVRQVEAGEIIDVPPELVEGLHDEELIGEASDDEIAAAASGAVVVLAPVEIPEGWAELHWFKLRALAEKIAGGPVPNKVAAVAVIEAELAKRDE